MISKGTFALVSGCRFFLMEILGLVFFALRRDLPMPSYVGAASLSVCLSVCLRTTVCGAADCLRLYKYGNSKSALQSPFYVTRGCTGLYQASKTIS